MQNSVGQNRCHQSPSHKRGSVGGGLDSQVRKERIGREGPGVKIGKRAGVGHLVVVCDTESTGRKVTGLGSAWAIEEKVEVQKIDAQSNRPSALFFRKDIIHLEGGAGGSLGWCGRGGSSAGDSKDRNIRTGGGLLANGKQGGGVQGGTATSSRTKLFTGNLECRDDGEGRDERKTHGCSCFWIQKSIL